MSLRTRQWLLSVGGALAAALGLMLFDWSVVTWLSLVWIETGLLVAYVVRQGWRRDRARPGTRAGATAFWSLLAAGGVGLWVAWGTLVGMTVLLVQGPPVEPASGLRLMLTELGALVASVWGWVTIALLAAMIWMPGSGAAGDPRADELGALVVRGLTLSLTLVLGGAVVVWFSWPMALVLVFLPIKCWAELTFLLPRSGTSPWSMPISGR